MYVWGITREQFNEILARQGGICAICSTETDDWHIDHDHSCCPKSLQRRCGKCIRGILCRSCNIGLGFVEKMGGKVGDYLTRGPLSLS